MWVKSKNVMMSSYVKKIKVTVNCIFCADQNSIRSKVNGSFRRVWLSIDDVHSQFLPSMFAVGEAVHQFKCRWCAFCLGEIHKKEESMAEINCHAKCRRSSSLALCTPVDLSISKPSPARHQHCLTLSKGNILGAWVLSEVNGVEYHENNVKTWGHLLPAPAICAVLTPYFWLDLLWLFVNKLSTNN